MRMLNTVKGTVLVLILAALTISFLGHLYAEADTQSKRADVYYTLLEEHTLVVNEKDSEINTLQTQIKELKSLVGKTLPQDQVMALKIKQYFPEDYRTALMVFKQESGLNPYAQNWNCYYFGVSTSCTALDRWRAWSVDCGLTQENILGSSCPKELFNPDYNLKVAKSKYQSRNWQPWASFTNGSYLQHEEWAGQIISDQEQLIALGVI